MSHSPSINPYEPGEVSRQQAPDGPIEFIGHRIKASMVRDIDYMVEGSNRYRAARRRFIPKPVSLAVRWGSGLFMIGLALVAVCLSRESVVYLFAFFLIMLGMAAIYTEKIDNVILRYKFKTTPFYNRSIAVVLTDEGYFSESPNERAKLLWSMFTDAMEFSDGVLIIQGTYAYHWLPFQSLENDNDSTILYRFIASRMAPTANRLNKL